MNTHLIDRFMAACGADSPLPLRISCAGWAGPVVRAFHQPYVVIGRNPRSDLCLNAPEVSPSHAYLQILGGSVFCMDLQSETGTHWPAGAERNGWLGVGEPIRIGPFTLEIAADQLEEDDSFGPPREWNPILSRSAQTSRIPAVTLELLNTSDRQPPRRLNRLLALVGSSPGCNVRLVSSTVSPVHCSLLRTPMGLWMIDLLGREGVRVNGKEMRYAFVQDGDEVQVGKFRLRVGSEAARPLSATVEMPAAAARSRAPSLAGTAGNGSDIEPNGHASPTAEPPRIFSAASVPADLSANSMSDLMLARRDEPQLLVPLVQQFQLMQQQLFDQFQQAMLMVVQMFTSMHRDQTEMVRKDLERVRQLTQELQTLQAELRKRQGMNDPPQPTPERASAEPPRETAARTTRPATPLPAGNAAVPDERIHAWLSDRMAALQQERQTQWQKIFKFLGGK